MLTPAQGDSETRAHKQEDFEFRLREMERRALLRSGVWVTLLVATGVALFVYTLKQAENARLEVERAEFVTEKLKDDAYKYQAQIQTLETALSNSREAVQYVTQGINFYHAGNYRAAVEAYDESLHLDPRNPYVLDLKGYSLFKMKNFEAAILTLQESVGVQPEYAWGHFDLARVYCAKQDYGLAKQTIEKALQIRPELRKIMNEDGEFLRLCAPIRPAFTQASPPLPSEPHEGSGKDRHPSLGEKAPSGAGSAMASASRTRTGCGVSATLRVVGTTPPDFDTRVQDVLFDKLCSLVKLNFKDTEASINFDMSFDLLDDGSVVKNSIQQTTSSGNSQFDDASKRAIEETRFPERVGQYRSGATTHVEMTMTYSKKTRSQPPQE